jgi:hypothetical protein
MHSWSLFLFNGLLRISVDRSRGTFVLDAIAPRRAPVLAGRVVVGVRHAALTQAPFSVLELHALLGFGHFAQCFAFRAPIVLFSRVGGGTTKAILRRKTRMEYRTGGELRLGRLRNALASTTVRSRWTGTCVGQRSQFSLRRVQRCYWRC